MLCSAGHGRREAGRAGGHGRGHDGGGGGALANWTWKAVRVYLREQFGVRLGKSACLRYLHRLGFVRKRPKKRLTKADAAKRAAFVRAYLGLVAEAERTGAKIFFVDEAHF